MYGGVNGSTFQTGSFITSHAWTCARYGIDARSNGRSEGQWALGYSEPLNAAETAKREDAGLNVRARIEGVYSKKGFRSIWPADLRQRFRWYGLYTQRPETDGYFMMRIRIPGGASRETWMFDAAWKQDGSSASGAFVLRKDPPASLVESETVGEYHLIWSR